ncbi:hypothetical protein GCM10010123_38940 [Pilimelia anulata]|uniref:LamG-like jellyroll fold domain-containing protein n=2 Tax=Pilimelia anulata TaxID=53371 RepID=A0A8J3BEQ6_9ACTN|nr:hypothetical protein GCM10010123_38940 [Pilimelia anulata]
MRGHVPRGRGALLLAAALAGSTIVAAPSGAATPRPPAAPHTAAAAERSAVDAARASGRAVEVPALHSEFETVTANPDGTLTTTITADAVRAAGAGGTWRGIDPALERRDSVVVPRSAAVRLEFSAGGAAAPLVRFGTGGDSFALRWPTPLPSPVLAGDTATYVDALPGVDVVLRAGASGYTQRYLVRSAAAAASLRGLTLGVESDGLRVRRAEHGGVAIVDRDDRVLWDGGAPTDVALDVRGDRIGVAPATGEPATYPRYADPRVDASLASWSYVSELRPTQKFVKFDKDAGVGRCAVTTIGDQRIVCDPQNPGSSYRNRMFFSFNLKAGSWAKRTIKKAVFRAYETHAFACTKKWVDLHEAEAAKVGSATWNEPPGSFGLVGARNVAYGHANCKAQGSWVEFADARLAKLVARKAKAKASIGLRLKARAEGAKDGLAWKRFRGRDAALSITYNTVPDKPTALGTAGPATGCVRGAARPWINATTPTLRVRNSEEDNQNLTTTFEVTEVNSDAAVTGGTDKNKPDSAEATLTVPANKLKHGTSYRWRATATDGQASSVPSDWCEFTVDTAPPAGAPTVTSPDYPADEWGKPAGTPGGFTFAAPADTDPVLGNDIVEYRWAFHSDQATRRVPVGTPGQPVSVTLTPWSFGPTVLTVAMVDRAGNVGARTARYLFKPTAPCPNPIADDCAMAAYPLDEQGGTTAADASPHRRAATVVGGSRVPGPQAAGNPADLALAFDGAAAHAHAASAVDTTGGYTVTAWVRPDRVDRTFAAVSQVGRQAAGFALGYRADTERWTARLDLADTARPAAVHVESNTAQPARAGHWVHLALRYDPMTRAAELYVDGANVGRAELDAGWNATAGLQLGRDRVAGAPADALPGAVDDVRLYQGVLSPGDIQQIIRNSNRR